MAANDPTPMKPTGPILCLLFLAWATAGYAQPYIDILRVDYATSTNNAFDPPPGTSDFQEWTMDLNLPIRLSTRNVLLTGCLYERIQVGLYPLEAEETVSTVNLKLGLNHRFSDSWSGTMLFLPKLSSDLTYARRADIQYGIAAMATWTRRADLQYKFGALYNTDLFGPFVTPLLGDLLPERTMGGQLPAPGDSRRQLPALLAPAAGPAIYRHDQEFPSERSARRHQYLPVPVEQRHRHLCGSIHGECPPDRDGRIFHWSSLPGL